MKGEWVQAAGETWHLVWQVSGEDKDEGVVSSWCHRDFKWDDPTKSGDKMSYEDILHDECVRKSEEL